jgi:hypothetical protein
MTAVSLLEGTLADMWTQQHLHEITAWIAVERARALRYV